VQGNDLVTDDIVASLQVLGDSSSGSEVSLDEIVGGPGSSAAGGDQASLRNFTPAKGARSQSRAVTCRLSAMLASLNAS